MCRRVARRSLLSRDRLKTERIPVTRRHRLSPRARSGTPALEPGSMPMQPARFGIAQGTRATHLGIIRACVSLNRLGSGCAWTARRWCAPAGPMERICTRAANLRRARSLHRAVYSESALRRNEQHVGASSGVAMRLLGHAVGSKRLVPKLVVIAAYCSTCTNHCGCKNLRFCVILLYITYVL